MPDDVEKMLRLNGFEGDHLGYRQKGLPIGVARGAAGWMFFFDTPDGCEPFGDCDVNVGKLYSLLIACGQQPQVIEGVQAHDAG